MIWDETYADANGNIYYNTCQVCDRYPAMSLDGQNYETHGPFCRQHWIDEVHKAFSALDRKLENEDWGSSPETRGEI